MTYTLTERLVSIPVTSQGLCRAFRAALLLTGNIRHAEVSVLHAIQSTDSEELSDHALLHESVIAALDQGPPQPDDLSSMLPVELRRVLRLPGDLRRSFVLRVLAGLSREECARLLCRDIPDVDQTVCAAAQELALPLEDKY